MNDFQLIDNMKQSYISQLQINIDITYHFKSNIFCLSHRKQCLLRGNIPTCEP